MQRSFDMPGQSNNLKGIALSQLSIQFNLSSHNRYITMPFTTPWHLYPLQTNMCPTCVIPKSKSFDNMWLVLYFSKQQLYPSHIANMPPSRMTFRNSGIAHSKFTSFYPIVLKLWLDFSDDILDIIMFGYVILSEWTSLEFDSVSVQFTWFVSPAWCLHLHWYSCASQNRSIWTQRYYFHFDGLWACLALIYLRM